MVFGKEYGLAYCSQSPYRISFSAHHPPHKHSPSSPTIANTCPFFTTLLTRLSRSNSTKTFSNSSNTMPSIPTSNGIFDETSTRKASHPLQTAKNVPFSQQHSQLNPPSSRHHHSSHSLSPLLHALAVILLPCVIQIQIILESTVERAINSHFISVVKLEASNSFRSPALSHSRLPLARLEAC